MSLSQLFSDFLENVQREISRACEDAFHVDEPVSPVFSIVHIWTTLLAASSDRDVRSVIRTTDKEWNDQSFLGYDERSASMGCPESNSKGFIFISSYIFGAHSDMRQSAH